MILAPHQFVELIGRNAEVCAKGTAELLLGKISVIARNGVRQLENEMTDLTL
jgi:hypothetical protein